MITMITAIAAVSVLLAVPVTAGRPVTQISGSGEVVAISDGITPAFTANCPEPTGYEDFSWITLEMTEGNLQGCIYTLVERYSFSPNEDASPVIYHESGREVFVGTLYDDDGTAIGEGTFETTYRFLGQFEDASLSVEIFGGCRHPIVDGTGTGVFADLTGLFVINDDVTTGALNYTGILKPIN